MTTPTEMQSKVDKTVTNMDRLDDFVNGGPTTDVTLDSGVVPSIQKMVAESGLASGSASAAEASAAAAAGSASAAAGSATLSLTSANLAESFATVIQELSLGVVYTTTASGIASTVNGEYFSVWADERIRNYLNDTGVAVFQNEILTTKGVNPAFLITDVNSIRLGYDSATDTTAAVKIGANDAFRGRGALQIGGAGKLDGGNGSYLVNDGHPNWNVLQSSIPFNPTELNIYGNGVGGVAVSTGTTTITRSTGSAWSSAMNGLTFWFDGVFYTVVSATSSTATLNSAPPAGTACWHFVYTTGVGTCTVSGGTVTRTSGEPFISHTFGSDYNFTLNGTTYTVTATNSTDSYTISSPPPSGTYSYAYRTNINNQVATMRLQLTAGASEENLSQYATPAAYVSEAQQSGSGKLRNWRLHSERQPVVEMAAYGKFVSLGGVQNAEALRALWIGSAVNRFDVTGAVTGAAPSFRTRGADTNINAGYDTKGTGSHVFTSGAFARTNFRVYGSAGVDYLTVDAGTGTTPMAAVGASTNIDIHLIPKGTGAVRLGTAVRFGTWTTNADAAVNGYITVVDDAGTTRKLATIA